MTSLVTTITSHSGAPVRRLLVSTRCVLPWFRGLPVMATAVQFGACASSPSNPPVTKAPWRSSTSTPACWRTGSSARSSCTAPTAGWCPSWPPATTCRRLLPLVRARAGERRQHAPQRSRRGRLHRRARADRGAADRGGARPQPRLRLGGAGARRAPPRGAPAGAAARARAAAVSRTWRCWSPAATRCL